MRMCMRMCVCVRAYLSQELQQENTPVSTFSRLPLKFSGPFRKSPLHAGFSPKTASRVTYHQEDLQRHTTGRNTTLPLASLHFHYYNNTCRFALFENMTPNFGHDRKQRVDRRSVIILDFWSRM